MDVEWRDDFEQTANTVLHKRASLYGPKTVPDYNNAPEVQAQAARIAVYATFCNTHTKSNDVNHAMPGDSSTYMCTTN